MTSTVALVAGGSVLLDPRTVPGLTDNTTYSVLIDSTAPLATAVYQLFPGGDGAMMYTGFSLSP